MFLQGRTPASVEFADVNGDGLTDLVDLAGAAMLGDVHFYINQNGGDFYPVQIQGSGGRLSLPPASGVSVRFADMNGNGSTDLVWVTSSGEVRFIEMLPSRAHLLWWVDNGIGQVTELGYGSSTWERLRDEATAPWRYRLPQPLTVLSRVRVTATGTRYVSDRGIQYGDGYYDAEEKQFRGFGRVQVLALGDDFTEMSRTRYAFDVGATDRYRKGLLLEEMQESGWPGAFRELWHRWTVFADCPLAGVAPASSPPIRSVCATAQEEEQREGAPAADWVRTREEYGYDGYGNRTSTAKLGVVSMGGGGCGGCSGSEGAYGEPCGELCWGDEQYEETRYVAPGAATGGRWLLRLPYETTRRGSPDGVATEERIYYDGPAFEGLGLGFAERGLVTRRTAKASAASEAVVSPERHRYDAHGNVVETWDANGGRRTFSYDGDALLLVSESVLFDKSQPPYALVREVTYHPQHEKPVTSTDWLRVEGGVVVSTPAVTRYDYDPFGRLAALTHPDDTFGVPSQRFAYELGAPVSRIVASERSNGASGTYDLTTVQCFDGAGHKLQTRRWESGSRYIVEGLSFYNPQGEVSQQYQAYGSKEAGCELAAPYGVRSTLTYRDGTGRVMREVLPDHDERPVPSKRVTGYGPLRETVWDEEDWDEASPHYRTPTTRVRDGLGRLVGVIRRLGTGGGAARTRLTYSELGALRSVIDGVGNEKWQEHDLLGRVVRVHDPDAGERRFEYDPLGNVIREVDGRGVATRRAYDEAGRLVREWAESNEAETAVTYHYDRWDECAAEVCSHGEGKLVVVRYPLQPARSDFGVDRLGYDERGQPVRMSRELGGGRFDFAHTFDNAGRPMLTTYPTGRVLGRVLDGLGRVLAVPGYVEEVRHTYDGQVRSYLLANEVETRFEYDDRLRLSKLWTRYMPTVQGVQDCKYIRDRVGNLLAIEDGFTGWREQTSAAQYRYDAWYRLTRARLEPGTDQEETVTFTHDLSDNLTSMTSSVSSSPANLGDYVYGPYQGRPAGPHAVSRAGYLYHRYDAAGQVVWRNGMQFAWDHRGRLVEARDGPQWQVRYGYGPGWDRVVKQEKAETAYYLAGDFEVRNGVATTYIRIGNQRVVKIEEAGLGAKMVGDLAPAGAPDGKLTSADVQALADGGAAGEEVQRAQIAALEEMMLRGLERVTYLHGDHLGTVTATTDELGAVVSRMLHYPYGEVRLAEPMLEDYGWTGQEQDRAAGVSYHAARYLGIGGGRWMSPDPLFWALGKEALERPFESANPYTYCGGNPTNQTDSDGLKLMKVTIDDKTGNLSGKSSIIIEQKMGNDLKSLLKHAVENNIKVHINSSFRTSSQQGGDIQKTGMTPAAQGTSPHEGGLALDFNLYDQNGSIIEGNKSVTSDNAFIAKAEELGFRWGGDFTAKDPIHIDAGDSNKAIYGYSNRSEAITENQKDYAENGNDLATEIWVFEKPAAETPAASAN